MKKLKKKKTRPKKVNRNPINVELKKIEEYCKKVRISILDLRPHLDEMNKHNEQSLTTTLEAIGTIKTNVDKEEESLEKTENLKKLETNLIRFKNAKHRAKNYAQCVMGLLAEHDVMWESYLVEREQKTPQERMDFLMEKSVNMLEKITKISNETYDGNE